MNPLQKRVAKLANLSEFSRISGVPLRTLSRIRAGNKVSRVTELAVLAALGKKNA